MARIRTIKPDFFRHEGLFEAEQETGFPLRVAFAGLWTAADRAGRFRWAPRQLKLDCLPFDDVDFSRVLDALATRGFIVKYAVDGKEYGAIPSWESHQIINNREKASDLPEPNENNMLTRVARVADASSTPLKQDSVEGKGRERKGKEISTRQNASDSVFEEFKKAYPRRKGGNPWPPARALFLSAVARGADPQHIIAAVRAGVGYDKDQIGTPYIPQAVKWLRDMRYADHQPTAAAQPAEINWRQAVELFQRHNTWHRDLGPSPDVGGCRAPQDLLIEFGYATAPPGGSEMRQAS